MSRAKSGRRNLARTGWVAAIVMLFGLLGAGNAQAIDFYRINNQIHQGVCIGLQQSTGPGVVVGPCNPSSFSQQWFDKAGSVRLQWQPGYWYEYWQMANRATNTCLGVHNGSQASGERLVVGPCQPLSDHSQLWAWTDDMPGSFGTYSLVNGHSGLCVGTRGSSLAGGTPVLQGTCAWTDSQSWLLSLM